MLLVSWWSRWDHSLWCGYIVYGWTPLTPTGLFPLTAFTSTVRTGFPEGIPPPFARNTAWHDDISTLTREGFPLLQFKIISSISSADARIHLSQQNKTLWLHTLWQLCCITDTTDAAPTNCLCIPSSVTYHWEKTVLILPSFLPYLFIPLILMPSSEKQDLPFLPHLSTPFIS